jgi:hypothetical protein
VTSGESKAAHPSGILGVLAVSAADYTMRRTLAIPAVPVLKHDRCLPSRRRPYVLAAVATTLPLMLVACTVQRIGCATFPVGFGIQPRRVPLTRVPGAIALMSAAGLCALWVLAESRGLGAVVAALVLAAATTAGGLPAQHGCTAGYGVGAMVLAFAILASLLVRGGLRRAPVPAVAPTAGSVEQ